MLSNYCSNIADKYGIKVGGVNKLVSNLGNKSKHLVHSRNLKFIYYLDWNWLKFTEC